MQDSVHEKNFNSWICLAIDDFCSWPMQLMTFLMPNTPYLHPHPKTQLSRASLAIDLWGDFNNMLALNYFE